MNKKDLGVLESIFGAEIEGRLPYQKIGPKHAAALIEMGWIAPMERVFGGRFPVRVKGYQLTHLGRHAYCVTCTDEGIK